MRVLRGCFFFPEVQEVPSIFPPTFFRPSLSPLFSKEPRALLRSSLSPILSPTSPWRFSAERSSSSSSKRARRRAHGLQTESFAAT